MRSAVPYFAVFVSGLCVMVVELVAGRLIAKHLGVSIYTWTAVIGIILAGIAGGNYVGGRLADRYTPRRALSVLFLLSSVLTASILVSERIVADWVALWMLDWPLRVALHVAAVFLVPSLLLGTVSPIAAKAVLVDARHTGRALGSIYAWGVIGSILGTFLSGFWLIPSFGTETVIWMVVVVLALMGLLVAGASAAAGAWIVVVAAAGVLRFAPWAWAADAGVTAGLRTVASPDVVAERESLYSHIRVLRSEKDGVERHHLLLDKMMHNTVVVGRPLDLQDAYARMFAGLTAAFAPSDRRLATLSIGGGGYVFPEYLKNVYPGSRIDVVEIDPAVTAVAAEALQVSLDGITSYHEDGRVFVNRLARETGEGRGLYDFVYLDAFNDYTVPWQLTTREFFLGIRTLLKPSGALLINFIDSGESGRLLGGLLNTLDEVFPHTDVFLEGTLLRFAQRNTFVTCSYTGARDLSALVETDPARFGVHRLTAQELAPVRRRTDGLVLTDRWAPTDNLLGPVILTSSRGLAAGALVTKGVGLLNENRPADAESDFLRALELDPASHAAHRYLGYVYEALGDRERSREHYRRSLQINPYQKELCIELALAAEKRGDPGESAQYLQAALNADPRDADVRVNLAISFAMQKRFPEAVSQLEQVLAAHPDHFGARKTLGRALLEMGELSRAERELSAARALVPADPSLDALLQRIAAGRGAR